MSRIMEDIAKQERHEEFLQFVEGMATHNVSLPDMALYSQHPEEEVVDALHKLRLSATPQKSFPGVSGNV